MKKLISVLCVLAMLLSLMAVAASADAEADQAAADAVAALIDAIYVQTRTEETDAQCAAAKAAWDALTDEQKELVEGEEADPDYFGRDTGDASLDDPRNADGIGENEILVVSFGTSFNDSRAMDIKGIEDAMQAAFPDWSVRRAFTAQIIINHVQAREDEHIDNMEQAMERAVNNGVKNLVIQPTHLMHGAEYDELMEVVVAYADRMNIVVAEPLLGPVGSDATVINEDKAAVAEAVVAAAVEEAGFESAAAAAESGVAFVLMGHGTSHTAKVSYSQMQTQMNNLGYNNVFIGTVEGEPEETECENVIAAVAEAGFTKVILRPLMVVAGDHANNDMAGDEEDSWKSMFVASENFESVECQISGLGRIKAVQTLYIAHTAAVIPALGEAVGAVEQAVVVTDLADGVYVVDVDTDSSMFHVNEACEGKGVLTVENGVMTLHMTLAGKGYTKLFLGSADEAAAAVEGILEFTEDTVNYSDGTSDVAYGFDIPVEALNNDIAVATFGQKSGTWKDHTVTVTNPVVAE